MFKNVTPYIPQSVSEILENLGSMMLSAPAFLDDSGYFPDRNIESEFYLLNEGMRLIRKRLGEEKYVTLAGMSDQMRAHFEADPEDVTGEATQGRKIIDQMMFILRGKDPSEADHRW
jgi:hypothetical protein